jgi:hypothetical protein
LSEEKISLETKLKPVGVHHYLAAEGDKDNQQDKSAAAPGAAGTPPKPKAVLQPVKQNVKHQ